MMMEKNNRQIKHTGVSDKKTLYILTESQQWKLLYILTESQQ